MVDSLAPVFAAGGFIGLFGAAALLIRQNFSEASRLRAERAVEIHDLKGEIANLKTENERQNRQHVAESEKQRIENYACRLQVNSLVTLLQQGGIALPDWLLRDNGGSHEGA